MDPRRRLRPLLLATALVTVLVTALAGCGSGGTDAGTQAQATTTEPSSTPDGPATSDEGSPSGDAAPEEEEGAVPELLDFEAETVGGQAFRGSSVAGRPVLLWFWAPWCPTCRGQVPQVQDIAATHGKALTVLGVGSLDSADAIADFAADVDEVTHLEDVDGELYRRFGITEQSSFVLLDETGEVVLQSGYGGSDELDAEVAAVVG